MKTIRLFLAALAAALILPACTTVRYKSSNGVEVAVTSFLNSKSIQSAKFNPATGALEVTGYSSEQTQVAAAVASAVATALAPVPKVP